MRRNFRFRLHPQNQLQPAEGEDCWLSLGRDPYFELVPADGEYPSGWVLIRTRLLRESDDCTLKLYYDAGKGISEATSVYLPVERSGEISQLVELPPMVRQLRWDPMQSAGKLVQTPIVISRVGPVERLLRMLQRFVAARRGMSAAEARARDLTWTRMLRDPEGTYSAASWLRNDVSERDYEAWVETFDTLSDSDRERIRAHMDSFRLRPLISIVMPVHNTPALFLRAAIDSVCSQLYGNWQLCIADDASTAAEVGRILEEYRRLEPRIKIEYRTVNGHISAASNSALALATGEFVALMDHDDVLSEQALYRVAAELNQHPDAEVLYSDEDKIDEAGRRSDAHFKSAWNPDLLLSQNYVSHLGVFRAGLLREVGGFREGFEGSQDYDLLLRCHAARKPLRVRHVPAVLYHWRAIPGSTALRGAHKEYATANGIRALEDYFRSLSMTGVTVEAGRHPTTYRVRYPVPDPPPRVALIIPTRDQCGALRACVTSILEKTTYPNFEIVIVDNQSLEEPTLSYLEEAARDRRVRVIRYDAAFNFSALNNFAVRQVECEVVGLINDDIEVVTPDWLTEMVAHAVRVGIGAVGAKLYYRDDTIQHAGIVLGVGGVAGHGHKHFAGDLPGYRNRLHLAQNVSAVTAACLLVRRETYEKTGGLDQVHLPIAFNDVDFCLRLGELGLRNLWTPYAELYHHESLSRGPETTPEKQERFRKEAEYMTARWGDRLQNDPYYSPMLTLASEDFRPDLSRPAPRPWLRAAEREDALA